MERSSHTRNGIIDIYRLVMAVIIMVFHSYHLFSIENYPFYYGRIFVEGFFALSGYFTVCYFEKRKMKIGGGTKEVVISSLKYTFNKYKAFFPYTFITVFVSLFVRHGLIENNFKVSMLFKAILESMMIIRGDSNVGVLWYMAAMLPMLPVLAIVVQKLSSRIYGLLAVLAVALWYFVLGGFGACFVPWSYGRAVAGLSLGILVYCCKIWIEKINYNGKALTILMYILLLFPIVASFLNIRIDRIIIISLVLGLSLCLSSKVIIIPENKFTDLCKSCSFPLYLVHLNIADLIYWYCSNYRHLSTLDQYIAYFIISFACMALLMLACKGLKRLKSLRIRKAAG